MLNAGEILIVILTFVALGQTIYLRKDLQEHGLDMWAYAALPIIAVTAIVIAAWHELPRELAEVLSYSLSALSVVALFVGALIAYWRR